MMNVGRLAVVVVAGAMYGCTSTPGTGPGAKDVFNVRLIAGPQNASQVGEASFAAQGDATNIVLTLSGVPERITRPVHLYTYIYQGMCGSLGPKPAYSLNEVVLAAATSPGGPGFTLNKLAPLPLEKLRSGGYAIVVRTQAPDLDNGRLRQECLNAHWFLSLADAQRKIEAWHQYHNEARCAPQILDRRCSGLLMPSESAMA